MTARYGGRASDRQLHHVRSRRKAIGRNPGQFRFELLVDHGGTPTDPEDDVELEFQVLKESTGRSDDFCEVALAVLA